MTRLRPPSARPATGWRSEQTGFAACAPHWAAPAAGIVSGSGTGRRLPRCRVSGKTPALTGVDPQRAPGRDRGSVLGGQDHGAGPRWAGVVPSGARSLARSCFERAPRLGPRARVPVASQLVRQPLVDEHAADVLARNPHHSARVPVVAGSRALGARRTGAGDWLDIDISGGDQLTQPRDRARCQHPLDRAMGAAAERRGVETGEAHGASTRHDGVAVDDADVAGRERLRTGRAGDDHQGDRRADCAQVHFRLCWRTRHGIFHRKPARNGPKPK